jgi:sugar phosphate isomerase/epimerase
MAVTRRDLLQAAVGGTAWMALAGRPAAADQQPRQAAEGLRVAMCDWNLGKTGQVEAIRLAREIGLDGVEVSINFPGYGKHLRDPAVQQEFISAMKQERIPAPSVALGVLNGVPLKSEPKAALWVADAIEVARALGAGVMLLAFFGAGELRMDSAQDVNRVVDVLRELAPRAEKAKVILGLENTLSAPDNLRIVEAVGSPWVMVYYDLKNSADQGRDVPAEIHLLGDRICQVHLKNGDQLLSTASNVDFPACAEALRDTGYRGWYVLETSSPSGDLIADTRANIEYVRRHFG